MKLGHFFTSLFFLFYQQSKSVRAQNSTTPPIITGELLEKYQNLSELSYLYVVQIELKVSRIDEAFADMEKRLDKLVTMAFVLATYKHRKQTPPVEIPTSDLGYNTKIIKRRQNGESTYISFVSFAGNEPVLGEVVAEDLTLLTVSQISATLRYPLGKIVSDKDIEAESTTKWWFLIAVMGAGVIIILIGWFLLFLFYNTCGYVYGTDEENYVSQAEQVNVEKALVIDSKPAGGGPAPKQQIALPSDGSNPSENGTKKPRLNKKTPRSCRTLSETYLDRRNKNERPSIRKTIQEAFSKTGKENEKVSSPTSFGPVADTENGDDVEMAKSVVRSEKKRRHTKIGPITAPNTTTTHTTNEQEGGETSGISVASSEETISTADEEERDEFDVSNVPETPSKFPKKNKNQKENDVKSEPESDYGSSLDEEKTKGEKEEVGEEHEDVRARPMTAKKQRTSLFGGSAIAPIPAQPKAWTVYTAGDKVAAFWNNHTLHNLPVPSSPSGSGVVEIKTSRSIQF